MREAVVLITASLGPGSGIGLSITPTLPISKNASACMDFSFVWKLRYEAHSAIGFTLEASRLLPLPVTAQPVRQSVPFLPTWVGIVRERWSRRSRGTRADARQYPAVCPPDHQRSRL